MIRFVFIYKAMRRAFVPLQCSCYMMRLLKADTLKLEDFNDHDVPHYATLSHTWGKEEVTFQEIQLPSDDPRHFRMRQKNGYQKIKHCCKQALDQRISYVWVDTCCIDKTSSAELTEAINSMFRWYQNSRICYAYLEDVDIFDAVRTSNFSIARADESNFWTKAVELGLITEQDLAKAKWFTRGWTLQELIAPRVVQFYIKGWKLIGTKSTMSAMLSSITGIDEESLVLRDPSSRSVARRMSWAAKRETTRAEDIAYCLLGIFDVNMPLLYGEGQYAFIRLQEEIMKDSDDQSLFAWESEQMMDKDPAEDSDEIGRGILASCPDEFARSRMVRPTSSRGEPYSMTNKGLRMQMPMLDMGQNLFLAILECSYEVGMMRRLGIILQKVGDTEQYVRHSRAALVRVAPERLEQAVPRVVYIFKKDTHASGRGKRKI